MSEKESEDRNITMNDPERRAAAIRALQQLLSPEIKKEKEPEHQPQDQQQDN